MKLRLLNILNEEVSPIMEGNEYNDFVAQIREVGLRFADLEGLKNNVEKSTTLSKENKTKLLKMIDSKISETGLNEEGGVDMELYTNLKLAKPGEFYEQEGPTARAELSRQGEGKYEEMIRYLRLYFRYLQSLDGGAEFLLNHIETRGDSEHGNPLYSKMKREALTGLKVVGLGMATGKLAINILYPLLINYDHNGGRSRDFSKGDINLIPATVYEFTVEGSEPVTEYNSVYLDIYGRDKELAQELANSSNFWAWEVDRETQDHDYDGEFTIDDVTFENTSELSLTPDLFNL